MTKRPDLEDVNSTSGLVGLGPIPGFAPVGAFNRDQIESLLLTKGISGIHYKHALNPDMESVNGVVNPNTKEAQWGVRYYQARPIKIVPQNFALQHQLNAQGIWGLHTVMLNVTGYYLDLNQEGKRDIVQVAPYDIILLDKDSSGKGVTTEVRQKFEYNPNGPMKLNYRVEGVDYLADRERRYVQDQDFSIVDGKIVWLPAGRKPSFVNGKGAVMSIVYYIKPVYVVKNVPHSIRILPSNSTGHGGLPREAMYAPQLLIAQQTWIRQDSQELLDFSDLPGYPEYRTTANTTGGTY